MNIYLGTSICICYPSTPLSTTTLLANPIVPFPQLSHNFSVRSDNFSATSCVAPIPPGQIYSSDLQLFPQRNKRTSIRTTHRTALKTRPQCTSAVKKTAFLVQIQKISIYPISIGEINRRLEFPYHCRASHGHFTCRTPPEGRKKIDDHLPAAYAGAAAIRTKRDRYPTLR